ncbi:MAG TPA: type II secretion system protein [Candidatus Saccharimonadales bacterium]
MKHSRRSQSAFTLIEMLVVAPMMILLIGTAIMLVAALTGSALQATKKNELTYQVQNALSTIEANAQYSAGTIASGVSTGPVTSPQGVNDSASAFVSDSGTLVMKLPATTQSPFSYGRSIIYAQPNCSTSTTPYPVYYVYFVKNGTLYERSILGSSIVGAACSTPFQRGSCTTAAAGVCQKEDEVLATNVANFSIAYGTNVAKVTLELKESVAGEDIGYSSTIYATHDDSLEGAPNTPAVGQAYNNDYTNTYSWPASDNTTGYNVTYCIGSDPCQNGPQNTLTRTFTLPVPRRQNVEVRVEAISSTGNFNYTPATSSAPSWQDCTPTGNWVNYANTYNTLGFTITSSGAVGLKGLVRSGDYGATLCTLPAALRPSNHLIFSGVASDPNGQGGNGTARIDVYTDGRITIQAGSNSTSNKNFVSLDGIIFMAGNPGWTSGTWVNGWYYNGSGYGDTTYPNLRYFKDSQNRAWVQGLATGTATSGSIATLPASMVPVNGSLHYPVAVNSRLGVVNVNTTPAIVARASNGSSSWVSTQLIYQASGTTGMTALPLYNSWTNYNAAGGTWTTANCKRGNDDIVVLQGLVKGGASSTTVKMSDVASCGSMNSGGRAIFNGPRDTDVQARIDLLTDDTLMPISTSTTWTSLDGIHYIAD